MNNVEEYLAAISSEAKPTLVTLRESIRRELPEATEVLSYGIPCSNWVNRLSDTERARLTAAFMR